MSEIGRNVATAPNQLHPGENDEQEEARPDAQPGWGGAAFALLRSGQLSAHPACAGLNRRPRIECGPERGEHGREEGKTHPAQNPDRNRSEVAHRILITEKSGNDHREESDEAERAAEETERTLDHGRQRHDQCRQRPYRTFRAEKDGDNDERKDDGGPRAPDVERQRYRQVVALSESVRRCDSRASGHARSECQSRS